MGRARNIGFYALFSKIFCFRLQIGVSYQLLKERGSKLAQIFVCGIKIDAAFGSGISAVASKLMPFWLPPHLFPVGEAIYQGVFEKHSKILLLRGNPVIAPSLTPCLKAILWPPSLIPSGKGSFLSSFQKNFRSLNPHLETVLSTYPAKISPTIPYSNFCGWKTTWFLTKFPHTPIPQL